ncbi:major tail sheath protein [Staphylococcus phage vB_SauH_DELF3]|nr:major tail sheath protein [Staphylococcus phage vB_SauH_DELF3]
MAVVSFPRRPVARPHAVSEIPSALIGRSAGSSEKVFCYVGSAEGKEPNTVYELRNYAQGERLLRSGEDFDAMELAWGSNGSYTAHKILAMRSIESKPASVGAGGIKITSVIYSNVANHIQVGLEKNTKSSLLCFLVIFQDYRFNEVDYNMFYIPTIKYTGKETNATYSVVNDEEAQKASRRVLNVGDQEVSSWQLTVGAYDYTNAIFTDINQLPDFEAKSKPFEDKNLES